MTGSEQERQQRIGRLTTAARQRTARAEQHAEKTIRRTLRDGEQVTFRGVHRRSGLSLDFLYTNRTIRRRIETAREAQINPNPTTATAGPAPDCGDNSDDGTLVRVLAARLQAAKRQYREETEELRRQLAVAAGEILSLRERTRSLDACRRERM